MIPNVHYSESEKYDYPERRTTCPHCGGEHRSDISFYKVCIYCRRPMDIQSKDILKETLKNQKKYCR